MSVPSGTASWTQPSQMHTSEYRSRNREPVSYTGRGACPGNFEEQRPKQTQGTYSEDKKIIGLGGTNRGQLCFQSPEWTFSVVGLVCLAWLRLLWFLRSVSLMQGLMEPGQPQTHGVEE